ncbi:MAG: hypothetical protein ABI836_12725 [Gemmatimonadota bacterium]
MDPQTTGIALGLLFGAAKIGFVGTVGFGIGWWRTRRKLQRLEAAPRLTDRLNDLEQTLDYTTAQLAQLLEGQANLSRQLAALPAIKPEPPDS